MAEAKIVIKGENQLGSAVKSASSDLKGLEGAAASVGKILKGSLVATAVVKSLKELGKAARECIDAFKVQEQAETRLNMALKNAGVYSANYAKQLKGLASSLQGITAVGDETIIEMESLFISTQKLSKDAIEPAVKASLDLAAAMGTDAKSSAQTLAKVLEDPIKGMKSLRSAGVTFNEAETETIKKLQESNDLLGAQKIILEGVEKRYSGFAEQLGNTKTAQLDKIKGLLGDIKEALGESLLNALSGIFEFVISSLGIIYDLIVTLSNVSKGTIEAQSISNAKDKDTRNQLIAGATVGGLVETGSNLEGFIERLISERSKMGLDVSYDKIAKLVYDSAEGVAYEMEDIYDALDIVLSKAAELSYRASNGMLSEDEKFYAASSGMTPVVQAAEKIVEAFDEDSFVSPVKRSIAEALEGLKKARESLRSSDIGQSGQQGSDDGYYSIPQRGQTKQSASDKALKNYLDINSNFAAESINGPLNSLLGSLGMFGDMLIGITPELAILKPIIEGFVSVMGPALDAVIAPITDALQMIGMMLARLFLPVLDAIAPIFKMIGNVLVSIMGIFTNLIAPALEWFGNLLNIVSAALAMVGGVVEWLAQAISNVVKYIWNFISHPFSPGRWNEGVTWNSVGSYIDGYGAGGSVATDAVSTTTAISSAGYNGATAVTINIYQNSPVVGSNGMREFAQMIKDEFDELSYYGVTS